MVKKKKRKLKICIMAWEMIEAGGIIRVVTGYQTGFEKLGHEVVTFVADKNGRINVKEDDYVLLTKWFRPKGKNLGWNNSEQMKQFKSVIKDCDLMLSVHGCPHPTKSGAIGDYGWQEIYKYARKYVPIGIVFTDTVWDKMYPWIVEVIEDDTKLFYNNWNAQWNCIPKLPHEAQFVDYPIDTNEVLPPVEKKLDVLWVPQWKRGKGLYEFIKELSEKEHLFQTGFINSGIEYYNIRLTPEWKKAIRRDFFVKKMHNKKSKANHYGILFPDKVNLMYARTKVTLDLSGAYVKRLEGLYTCTMAESMVHKALVAVSPDSLTSERSRIRGLPIAYPVRTEDLIGSLNEAVQNEALRQTLVENAHEWAMQNCTDEVVCQKMVDYMLEK